MGKSKMEMTLKNAKVNHLMKFQLGSNLISLVKHTNNLNGGLFEMNTNKMDWSAELGYLTLGEVMEVLSSLKN